MSSRRLSRTLPLLSALFLLSACSLWANSDQPGRRVEDSAADTDETSLPVVLAESGDDYPIMFVTQPPIAEDFATIGSTFANHLPTMQNVGRGGDLWIRYPDGTLKNLTEAAGFGSSDPTGFQGADAIAVRDPNVHWDGERAIFSMVIGAPTEQYVWEEYYWQLYEVTGLGREETPVISLVPNQPAQYNNISPIYGTDGRIIFTTDRPRNGAAHLYPQLDEYEETATVTGLWSLDPANGNLRLLHHAPSGAFTPMLDSFGRVLFTNWDHLQRDQQADSDREALANGEPLPYGTFNYTDESAGSTPMFDDRREVFPEPRSILTATGNLNEHSFNHFFPWQIREDGTDAEVLNHLGRHELHDYFTGNFTDDPNIVEFYDDGRFNPNSILNLFHIAEAPNQPGLYYAVDAPEFGSHSAGYLVSLSAPPTLDADHISLSYVTDPENGDGSYRSPLPLSNGGLVAVHADFAEYETGSGLDSDYAFRLVALERTGDLWTAAAPLTTGIAVTISYWSPDEMMTYSGNLWELDPVEVRPRVRPIVAPQPLPEPEQQILAQAGVSLSDLQAYLEANGLALVISRNVTRRDDADRQQPFNLRIAGSDTQTIGASGRVYDIAYLQFLQGDQIRGLTGCCQSTPQPGRRVLAQYLHDVSALNANPPSDGPAGSVALAVDGSMAAFVPANRALSWQLTGVDGKPYVRERYWLSFQPGEVRVCAACHGLNEYDQAGGPLPENPPEALLELLLYWQGNR